MDLFTFNTTYRTWICMSCQTSVPPRDIWGHLAGRQHRTHPSACTQVLRQAAAEEAWWPGPWDPVTEPFQPPPPDALPIPGLRVYQGYACPEDGCTSYATPSLETL